MRKPAGTGFCCPMISRTFVTALAVVSIALIEVLLHAVRLDAKNILWTNITLGEWMFCLEVMAVTAVLGVGIIKAVLAIGKAS